MLRDYKLDHKARVLERFIKRVLVYQNGETCTRCTVTTAASVKFPVNAAVNRSVPCALASELSYMIFRIFEPGFCLTYTVLIVSNLDD